MARSKVQVPTRASRSSSVTQAGSVRPGRRARRPARRPRRRSVRPGQRPAHHPDGHQLAVGAHELRVASGADDEPVAAAPRRAPSASAAGPERRARRWHARRGPSRSQTSAGSPGSQGRSPRRSLAGIRSHSGAGTSATARASREANSTASGCTSAPSTACRERLQIRPQDRVDARAAPFGRVGDSATGPSPKRCPALSRASPSVTASLTQSLQRRRRPHDLDDRPIGLHHPEWSKGPGQHAM